jgi:hypothetical protein
MNNQLILNDLVSKTLDSIAIYVIERTWVGEMTKEAGVMTVSPKKGAIVEGCYQMLFQNLALDQLIIDYLSIQHV